MTNIFQAAANCRTTVSMRVSMQVVALLMATVVVLASCGSSDTGGEADDIVEQEPTSTVEMIPVEPDGGIGDGAGPIPGLDEDDVDGAGDVAGEVGTWHGSVVAETNCPGTNFQRVEGSVFSFSVPVDFVDQGAQPLDSEIGYWQNPSGSIEASFDYGWYSGPLSAYPGAEVTAIDFSGFVGEHVVIRNSSEWPKPNVVGVHFGELVLDDPQQWNALNLVVQHDDPADEIIGRCIVDSIEWKITPAG